MTSSSTNKIQTLIWCRKQFLKEYLHGKQSSKSFVFEVYESRTGSVLTSSNRLPFLETRQPNRAICILTSTFQQ